MKKVFIKKNEFGFSYQTEGDRGYRYFPDPVNNRQTIENYLRSLYNAVDLQFVNQAGQPAKLYTIKSGEKIAGERVATVDFDRKFVFNDVTSDAEKLEFLRFHLPEDPEVEGLESDHDKVMSYLQQADEGLKSDYKIMIAEKLTPEVMKIQCEKNALSFGDFKAEVVFAD